MKQAHEVIRHNIPPVYNEDSKILILGSFPSVKSRETEFFYGHPKNRFWRVLAHVFESPVPETIEEKTAFLLKNGIALWDVIESCTITGSSDSSIKDAKPNDIAPLLNSSCIHSIFTNGKTAYSLYSRLIEPTVHIKAHPLPSTSPANAAFSFKRLCAEWKVIRN